ncbi:hypothetical protein ACOT81_44615 [Streptomyces sp. WI04-05B]|uniref:hypothetical protein n=1 Tax=Streptomyces TaxID=1883 RepID=UPI0029A04B06|nr:MULTISPECIES: hypothetical protein [unclassified Streptomyces]MDX2545547.1 hypothetical protein [Streptomyces sp. WI04-05B]MDX2586507.1 hypothetical protein [Streptomyces sp. WI04-05A]
MAVEQLPGQVREFARYLNGLLARLDQDAGWCGVFWQRDPDGMRACLEGAEVPPWDVVDALLQDLAAGYGTAVVASEAEPARALHQSALAAFDTRPDARDTLGDRLDVMLREQKYAAERLAELGRSLASAATHEEAEGLRLDLAWAHDDHERASARCVELRYRLDQLARRVVSRAPSPHRDRDDEADLFTGRVQHTPHPADAPAGDSMPLPRQRTHLDGQRPAGTEAAWYDEAPAWRDGTRGPGHPTDEAGAHPTAYGTDRAPGGPGSGDEARTWRTGSGHAPDEAAARPAAHGDDPGPGRQGPGGEARAWRDGARESDDLGQGRRNPGESTSAWRDGTGREGARPAAYGDDRGPDGQGSGDESFAWREGARYGGDRGSGQRDADGTAPAWRDGTDRDGARPAAYGDDRGPGRQGPGDGASAWRDGARRGEDRGSGGQDSGDGVFVGRDGGPRSGQGDAPDEARQADAPGGTGASAERTTPPQLPADWYEPSAPAPEPVDPRPASKQRAKRRARGSARFAGMIDDADTGATPTVDPTRAPVMPAPAATPGRRTPRGARFAGAAAAAKPAAPVREALDDDARHDTIDTVRTLVRLRGEGRTGEAHALLVESSQWPAARFPLLAAELHRAGLGADWATLLWEAASLPVDRLVDAADALVAAGRATDGEQILRQGMARPAQEVGEAVLRLAQDGRRREVRALLDAYVRVRTPAEAARSVAVDPQRLVPLLLEAARGASEDCYWDLVHALRVAGHSA